MLRRKSEWSVRTRLTILATLVMTLLCAGFSALILTSVHTERTTERSRRSHDANMRAIALLARGELASVHAEPGVAALQMIDPAGRVVAASPNMRERPPMTTFVPREGRLGRTETLCDMPVFAPDCMLVSATLAPRRDGDWIGYAAAPVYPWYVSGRLPGRSADRVRAADRVHRGRPRTASSAGRSDRSAPSGPSCPRSPRPISGTASPYPGRATRSTTWPAP